MRILTLYFIPLLIFVSAMSETRGAAAEVKNLSVNGGLEDGKARLVIEAVLNNLPSDRDKLIYATALQQSIKAGRDRLTNIITATLDILQGEPKELSLAITGDGEIRRVTRRNPGFVRGLSVHAHIRQGDVS